MEGLYIHSADNGANDGKKKDLSLLAKHGDLEIMTQRIAKSSAAWLCPAEREDAFEFYYLLSGKVELTVTGGTGIVLGPGDSFTLKGLKENIVMRCLANAQVLCITNTPAFNDVTYWRETWMEQLKRIDEKDHYTLHHSQAVMYYAMRLFEELKEYCSDFDINDFVVSALFHDIGKCNVPLNILCKPEHLSEEEYEIIKRHPAESRKILRPLYGERMAALAGMHHERLDGSGYPDGIKGDKIPFEVRILMVADAFDAMTRRRVYREPVGMEEAARELNGLPTMYDEIVTAKLLELILDGKLELYSDHEKKANLAPRMQSGDIK